MGVLPFGSKCPPAKVMIIGYQLIVIYFLSLDIKPQGKYPPLFKLKGVRSSFMTKNILFKSLAREIF